jgi:hypothetical protein
MPSALDTLRAQQQAADAVYSRLQDVAALLHDLRKQTDALQHTNEMKLLLEREERWLREARAAVTDIRRWRESEAHAWRGVVARWIAAGVFAIGTAAAAGAGYAAIEMPAKRELQSLQRRLELTDYVQQRVMKMTPTQKRQFDALMGLTAEPLGRHK